MFNIFKKKKNRSMDINYKTDYNNMVGLNCHDGETKDINLIDMIDYYNGRLEQAYRSKKSVSISKSKLEELVCVLNVLSVTNKQYSNLRDCFSWLTEYALGKNYYNEASDVYTCDYNTIRDIANKI